MFRRRFSFKRVRITLGLGVVIVMEKQTCEQTNSEILEIIFEFGVFELMEVKMIHDIMLYVYKNRIIPIRLDGVEVCS